MKFMRLLTALLGLFSAASLHADPLEVGAKAPAVTARSHRNSSRIGGNSSEKAVRALTPMPIDTNTTATISQP